MKIITFLIALIIASFSNYAQTTGFNYQAVVHNSDGELVKNQDVSVLIDILENSASGSVIFSELHNIPTNSYGVLNIKVGLGNNILGDISTIDWSDNDYFLQVSIDLTGGNDYKLIGATQVLSVPSALYASKSNLAVNAENATNSINAEYALNSTNADIAGVAEMSNSAIYSDTAKVASSLDEDVLYFTDTDTLFAVKDRNGNIVFAVYPDGVQIFVDESTKGKVGGFAVSGRSPTKAGNTDILKVTADSTRIYVNPTATKGKVGGFAVSGRSPTKGLGDEFMVITADSTRIYVNQTATKGKVGGFAVSGRSPTKAGSTAQFMSLTPDNYFIGHNTGASLTTGLYNIMLGYESGLSNQSGSYNTFLGYQSGYLNTASFNSFLGYLAGRENTIGAFNTFMGYESGRSNDDGDYNVFIGHQTGFSNTGGHENVFIGFRSGYSNTAGYDNIFIGNLAGENASGNTHSTFIGNEAGKNMTGDDNICIGDRTGTNDYATSHETFGTVILGIDAGRNVVGENNTVLGYSTGSSWGGASNGTNNTFVGAGAGSGGYLTRLGSDNVCLGNYAGFGKTGDNKLYIANNSSSTLIYGEFDNNQVVINGVAADNPLDYTFYVNGSASGNNPWANVSDFRLKKNINTIDSALNKVLKLRGVYFDWKDPEMKGHQIGFIAQEAKEVIPEVVIGSDETEYSMQYAPITAVIVEAMKEQQQKIDTLENQNKELLERIKKLEELILNQ